MVVGGRVGAGVVIIWGPVPVQELVMAAVMVGKTQTGT